MKRVNVSIYVAINVKYGIIAFYIIYLFVLNIVDYTLLCFLEVQQYEIIARNLNAFSVEKRKRSVYKGEKFGAIRHLHHFS